MSTKPKPAKPTVAPANARPGQGQPRPPVDRPRSSTAFKVMATKVCYYDDKRRRVGDVFTIQNETEFSSKYMERVAPDVPERITTGAEVLKREHETIKHNKAVENHPELGERRTSDQAVDGDDD
jgi:hypothetical protein